MYPIGLEPAYDMSVGSTVAIAGNATLIEHFLRKMSVRYLSDQIQHNF